MWYGDAEFNFRFVKPLLQSYVNSFELGGSKVSYYSPLDAYLVTNLNYDLSNRSFPSNVFNSHMSKQHKRLLVFFKKKNII